MQSVKYYNLESGADGNSELEGALGQHFVKILRFYRELGDVVGGDFRSYLLPVINKTAENVDEAHLPAGDFFNDAPVEILYQDSRLISPRWRFFAKHFAAETVVRGAAAALTDFEDYLEKNDVEIKQSRVVSRAAFCISAGPESNDSRILPGLKSLGKIITQVNYYAGIECKLEYPCLVAGATFLEGVLYGPVEPVLSLRELLVEGEALRVPLTTYGLRFE